MDDRLNRLADDLWQISLSRSDEWPEPLQERNNVYLVGGATPTLINAGHPSQFSELSKALRGADMPPDAVERVIYTSWSIDVLGGVKNFPRVDHFVASPDMFVPRDYESRIAGRREAFRELADAMLDEWEFESFDRWEVDRFVSGWWPPVSKSVDLIPLRNGHSVRAGALDFEVLVSPGTGPGNIALFEREREWLFCGDISCGGLPFQLDDVRSYLVSLERLIDLDVDRLFPNRGDPKNFGTRVLQSSLSYITNFMSNAPSAMYSEPTLVEFVERNLGYRPESFVDLLWRAKRHRELMEELVRSQMIESEGSGVARRYGVDVEDPREKVRKHQDEKSKP